MPVLPVDADLAIQSAQRQLETQENINEEEGKAKQREKQAEKNVKQKLEQKAKTEGRGVDQRSGFQTQNRTSDLARRILTGEFGQESAQVLEAFRNSKDFRQKSTQAQRQMFEQGVAKDPRAGKVMLDLSKEPSFFGRAITTTQPMGELLRGVFKNAATAEPTAKFILPNPLMQSPKSPPDVKADFLRTTLEQANQGNQKAVKDGATLMGRVAQGNVGASALRAAVSMFMRQPNNTAGMKNVGDFVEHAAVQKRPASTRTLATTLLAKTNGQKSVKDGFVRMCGLPSFGSLRAKHQTGFFRVLGSSGRLVDVGALATKMPQILNHSDFDRLPERAVSKLLTNAAQAAKQGPEAVKADQLVRSAKTLDFPTPPVVRSLVGLSHQERAQTVAQIMRYLHALDRHLSIKEKALAAASKFEQVAKVRPQDVPIHMFDDLEGDELDFVKSKVAQLKEKKQNLVRLTKTRSRELAHVRERPRKRHAGRPQGRQEQYFVPGAKSERADQAIPMAAAQAGPNRPAFAQERMPLAHSPKGSVSAMDPQEINVLVKQALGRMGSGALTPDNIASVASNIAQQVAGSVAGEVARQVTAQLLGNAGGAQEATQVDNPKVLSSEVEPTKTTVTGKTDAWGVQRTFVKELGGSATTPVTPKAQLPEEDLKEPEPAQAVRGPALTLPQEHVRSLDQLLNTPWKQLSRAETALMRDLGWDAMTWGSKFSPSGEPVGQWPVAMGTLFHNLSPFLKKVVRQLLLPVIRQDFVYQQGRQEDEAIANEWNKRVQALGRGTGA